jgi:hypothetical protein
MLERGELNNEQAARLLEALCLRHAALGLRLTSGLTAAFEVGGAQIEIAVAATDAERPFTRRADFTLCHHVHGELDEIAELVVRDRLADIAGVLPALAACMLGEALPPDAAVNPVALISVANAARRAWLEHGRVPQVHGLPPCLAIEMRPDEPREPIESAHALPPPCNDCSHALWCSANAVPPRDSRQGLRPLRHRESVTAVHAGLRAISSAWDAPESATITAWVSRAIAMRRGELSGPVPPFELSLKREGDRLAPLVRVVDLQVLPTTSPPDAFFTRRRELLRESARGLNTGEAADAIDEFIALIAAHQSRALVSYGVEAPVQGGLLRTQLYAHMESGGQRAIHALVRAALSWAGASDADVARITTFSEPRSVALIVHAPQPDDPRRTKIYIRAPLGCHDPGTGLEPLARPPHAPSWGLAVLCAGSGGVHWEKRDFPCAVQFQSAGSVFEDFVAGMVAEDAQRVHRIVDGRDFAAWPTWLSMRPKARTVYFNPR